MAKMAFSHILTDLALQSLFMPYDSPQASVDALGRIGSSVEL
jgi:hypothetical protein